MGRTPNSNLKIIDYDGGLSLAKDFNDNMRIIDEAIGRGNEISSANTINYYVDGANGDDSKDGLSWVTAFLTPKKAAEVALAHKNLYEIYEADLQGEKSIPTGNFLWEPYRLQKPHFIINLSSGFFFMDTLNSLYRDNPCIEYKGTLETPIFGSGGPSSGVTTGTSDRVSVQVDLSTGTPWADGELNGMLIKFENIPYYVPIEKNTDLGAGIIKINLPISFDGFSGTWPTTENFTIHDFGTTIGWFQAQHSLSEAPRKILRNRIRHCTVLAFSGTEIDIIECKTGQMTNGSACILSYLTSSATKSGNLLSMSIVADGKAQFTANIYSIFDCIEARFNPDVDNRTGYKNAVVYNWCNFKGATIVGKYENNTPQVGNGQSFGSIYSCNFYDTTSIDFLYFAKIRMRLNSFEDTFLGIKLRQGAELEIWDSKALGTGTLGTYFYELFPGAKLLKKIKDPIQVSGTPNDYILQGSVPVTGNMTGIIGVDPLAQYNGAFIQEVADLP